MAMNASAELLRDALVEAYPSFVDDRLAELGVDRESVAEAVEEGRRWLMASLDELLSAPFERQRRGPLEVFQESMKFPTEALSQRGVPPTERDETTARILPGDIYDLAPASSSQLGEDVWRAHLAWGAAKARAMSGAGD